MGAGLGRGADGRRPEGRWSPERYRGLGETGPFFPRCNSPMPLVQPGFPLQVLARVVSDDRGPVFVLSLDMVFGSSCGESVPAAGSRRNPDLDASA
jgi:hypothetical protein